MKIALVTNTNPHHLFWAYSLYKKFNVTLILHPHPKKSFLSIFKEKDLFKYGFFWFCSKIISVLYNSFSSKSMMKRIRFCETAFFNSYKEKYKEIPQEVIHHIRSVNSPDIIEMIKNHDIDIICFLGGEIAKKGFINAAKIACLNFHSGISPFYNGNKSIFHTISDFKPNFAGGTLMYMTERIDGGPIISHYLTSINEEDNAASLFMKGIEGAVKLYSQALNLFIENNPPHGIVQNRSFKYTRFIDWSIANDIKLRTCEKSSIFRYYKRNEEVFTYYKKAQGETAYIFGDILAEILKKK